MSRRRILSAAGGAAAGGVLATGTASAQQRVTSRVMIPRAEDIPADGYKGLFLHVGETTPGELDPATLRSCEFGDWPVDGVTYHKGTLIDNTGAEVERVPSTIYTNERSRIAPGTLWGITATVGCPENYVGLRLEEVGTDMSAEETGNGGGDSGDGGGAGAFGPGFGALGVAAAAGVGGALAKLRGDDS